MFSHKAKYFLLILLITTVLKGFSQTTADSSHHSLSAGLHYGFVMPHHSFIEYLLTSHIKAAEITWSRTLINDSIFYKPEKGIGLFYSEMGNNLILGKSISIFGYHHYNLWHSENERFRSDLRVALGLSYANKTFDILSNNQNLAISSHLNAHINLGLQCSFQISSSSVLNGGLRFSHLSNGKLSAPNNGLNIFTTYASYSYRLNEHKKTRNQNYVPQSKTWMLEAIAAGGISVIAVHTPGRFFVSSMNLNAYSQYNRKYRWGIGADVFYNQSNHLWLETNNLYDWLEHKEYKPSANFSGGIHLVNELCHNRLTYTVQMGSYLQSAIYGIGGLYHRIGIKYSITQNFMLNLTLKSHWAVAEYIEWGIGYRITKNRKRS